MKKARKMKSNSSVKHKQDVVTVVEFRKLSYVTTQKQLLKTAIKYQLLDTGFLLVVVLLVSFVYVVQFSEEVQSTLKILFSFFN